MTMLDTYLINLVSVSLQLQVVTITKVNSNQCISFLLNIQEISINETNLLFWFTWEQKHGQMLILSSHLR